MVTILGKRKGTSLGDLQKFAYTPSRKAILEFLTANRGVGYSVNELSTSLGLSYSVVYYALQKLIGNSVIWRSQIRKDGTRKPTYIYYLKEEVF
jgi:predicted transcriptional regulator